MTVLPRTADRPAADLDEAMLLLLQATQHDAVTIPTWLVTAIIAASVALLGLMGGLLGALLHLANRYGRLTKTVEDVSRKCDAIEKQNKEDGSMSAASRERFARIEKAVETHAEEIVNMRHSFDAHHNNADVHVTREWRDEWSKRFDRLEERFDRLGDRMEQLLKLALGPKT